MNEFCYAPGTTVPAVELLLQWEGMDTDALEQVLLQMEEQDVTLDCAALSLPAASGETALRLSLEHRLAKQGLEPSQLEKNDPLRLYLEELAAIPVCGDIALLAEQLSEENRACRVSEALCSQIVELSLSRVVELAATYTGKGVLLLDLIQEGSLGLWRATQAFTGDGREFEAFRDRKIRFYLEKAVLLQAYDRGVGEKLRTAVEDLRSVDERLLSELGRNPTAEEIAQALHMSVEETEAVAKTLENVRLLNRTLKPEPEELPQEEEQAVEDTAYFQMRQRIAADSAGERFRHGFLKQHRAESYCRDGLIFHDELFHSERVIDDIGVRRCFRTGSAGSGDGDHTLEFLSGIGAAPAVHPEKFAQRQVGLIREPGGFGSIKNTAAAGGNYIFRSGVAEKCDHFFHRCCGRFRFNPGPDVVSGTAEKFRVVCAGKNHRLRRGMPQRYAQQLKHIIADRDYLIGNALEQRFGKVDSYHILIVPTATFW